MTNRHFNLPGPAMQRSRSRVGRFQPRCEELLVEFRDSRVRFCGSSLREDPRVCREDDGKQYHRFSALT